jgi:hypothetical protein
VGRRRSGPERTRAPGEREAIALAEGVVAALVPRCRAVGGDVVYLGGEVLRIPARYEMCEVR